MIILLGRKNIGRFSSVTSVASQVSNLAKWKLILVKVFLTRKKKQPEGWLCRPDIINVGMIKRPFLSMRKDWTKFQLNFISWGWLADNWVQCICCGKSFYLHFSFALFALFSALFAHFIGTFSGSSSNKYEHKEKKQVRRGTPVPPPKKIQEHFLTWKNTYQ